MIPFSDRTNIFIHYTQCKDISDVSNVLDNTKFYGISAYDIKQPNYLFTALDCGCVPIHIRQINDDSIWKWLYKTLHLVEIKTNVQGGQFMELLISDSKKGDRYAQGIYEQWIEKKRHKDKSLI